MVRRRKEKCGTHQGWRGEERKTNTMNKPKFLEDIPPGYYEDPYKTTPVCKVNLLELSRYARKVDKKLVDLTKDEVERFVEDEHTRV